MLNLRFRTHELNQPAVDLSAILISLLHLFTFRIRPEIKLVDAKSSAEICFCSFWRSTMISELKVNWIWLPLPFSFTDASFFISLARESLPLIRSFFSAIFWYRNTKLSTGKRCRLSVVAALLVPLERTKYLTIFWYVQADLPNHVTARCIRPQNSYVSWYKTAKCVCYSVNGRTSNDEQ